MRQTVLAVTALGWLCPAVCAATEGITLKQAAAKVAKEIAAAVKDVRANIDKSRIVVHPFRNGYDKGSTAEPGVTHLLIEELAKQGLESAFKADIQVKGEYEVYAKAELPGDERRIIPAGKILYQVTVKGRQTILSSEHAVPATRISPARKSAQEKPAQEKPAQEKPAQEKPAQEKPAQPKPAQEKPAEKKATKKPKELTALGYLEKLVADSAQARLALLQASELVFDTESDLDLERTDELLKKLTPTAPTEQKQLSALRGVVKIRQLTAGEKPAGEKPAKEKPANEKPAGEKPAIATIKEQAEIVDLVTDLLLRKTTLEDAQKILPFVRKRIAARIHDRRLALRLSIVINSKTLEIETATRRQEIEPLNEIIPVVVKNDDKKNKIHLRFEKYVALTPGMSLELRFARRITYFDGYQDWTVVFNEPGRVVFTVEPFGSKARWAASFAKQPDVSDRGPNPGTENAAESSDETGANEEKRKIEKEEVSDQGGQNGDVGSVYLQDRPRVSWLTRLHHGVRFVSMLSTDEYAKHPKGTLEEHEEDWKETYKKYDRFKAGTDPNELLVAANGATYLAELAVRAFQASFKDTKTTGEAMTFYYHYRDEIVRLKKKLLSIIPNNASELMREIVSGIEAKQKWFRDNNYFAEQFQRAEANESAKPTNNTTTTNTATPTTLTSGPTTADYEEARTSIAALAGQVKYLNYQVDYLTRSKTQEYTAWKKSGDGSYYYCTYKYIPDGADKRLKQCCLYFPSRPDYIYFYNDRYCVYWGRYNINAANEREFAWLPGDRREVILLGHPPTHPFASEGPLPTVHRSVNPNQRMLWPPTIGLPGVTDRHERDALQPVEEYPDMEPPVLETFEPEEVPPAPPVSAA